MAMLNLPVHIPWKQIAVSPDMMDTKFCNKRFPFAWRSSLAISAFEPKLEDLPEELCDERITYLKITCTITGYQPTEQETRDGYIAFPNVPTEELDRIFSEYFACYGVMLNVAVFPRFDPLRPEDVELKDYPHIIAIEPKRRDFYQAATDTGEVLTASKSGVNTDKTLTHLESTESSTSFGATLSYVPSQVQGGWGGGISASTSRKRTDSDEDRWSVQTDASRERRETQGTTTQLSQMYNLLTGYHQGTNRAVFLMLPRPHVLQPTDRRTFVQGLRIVEGIQEFFLIVARPVDIGGLCVEALLETGHFPEEVEEEKVPIEPEKKEDLWHMPTKYVERTPVPVDEYKEIFQVPRPAPAGWVYDRSKGDGNGVEIESNNSDDWLKESNGRPHLEFEAHLKADATVEIAVRARPEHVYKDGKDAAFENNPRDPERRFTRADLTFKSYYVEEDPPDPGTRITTDFLITSRRLCACLRSGEECVEVAPLPPILKDSFLGDWIVDETGIEIDPALLTRDAIRNTRMPAMKELLRKIQVAMTTSWRLPRRHEFGAVGFLESDYFKEQIRKVLPKDHLKTHLGRLSGLLDAVVKSLGEQCAVAEALEMDLTSFAKKTGLSIEEAGKARRKLLGLPSPEADEDSNQQSPRREG